MNLTSSLSPNVVPYQPLPYCLYFHCNTLSFLPSVPSYMFVSLFLVRSFSSCRLLLSVVFFFLSVVIIVFRLHLLVAPSLLPILRHQFFVAFSSSLSRLMYSPSLSICIWALLIVFYLLPVLSLSIISQFLIRQILALQSTGSICSQIFVIFCSFRLLFVYE